MPSGYAIFIPSYPCECRSSQLYKIAHWGDRSSDSRLLSVYRFPFPDRISTLAILPGESLFAAGESRIAQFHLAMCATYTACVTCATDPYCAWNTLKQACFRRETAHLAAVGYVPYPARFLLS